MAKERPNFQKAWTAFKAVNIDVQAVGAKIGGKVKANIDSGIFQNACPIRISYALNRSGFKIKPKEKYAVVSGSDGNWYLFRVVDAINFLSDKFGTPDVVSKPPTMMEFSGKRGIMVTKGHGWSNATGHVTLWDGTICADTCHSAGDPSNGDFVPEVTYLWILA